MNGYEIPLSVPAGAHLGPGSQPVADDDHMDFPAIPQGMATYQPPSLPEEGVAAERAPAVAVLARLQAILDAPAPVGTVDLTGLGDGDRWLVDEILGEGEVSIRVEGVPGWRIQESVFAGAWRVESLDGAGQVTGRAIEVGPVPALVMERGPGGGVSALAGDATPPAGVINAPAIVTELVDHARGYRPGHPAHVVNLTLLPLSPEDLGWLQERLGQGAVTMLSRGYGNCRITATALGNVWWVQYFNTMDTLILNTLEVVDVPAVARAAPEDLEDSAGRLREVMEALA